MNLLSKKELEMQNPMREALENWEILQSELEGAKTTIHELETMTSSLSAEVDYLRQMLASVTAERDRYKVYAVEITTRLSGIKESILVAEAGSREFALKPPIPTQAPQITAGEVREVEALVAQLPQRLPQNAFG
jgi:predicted nuclease with TOPRIM domain